MWAYGSMGVWGEQPALTPMLPYAHTPTRMTAPDALLLMGRCGRAHGIRGDVKVYPETDDPGRFAALERVFVGKNRGSAHERAVEAVRYQHPKGATVVLLKLEGVEDREAAEALTGAAVYADEADLPPLADDEMFLSDLIGLEAVAVDDAGEGTGERLGTIRDVLDGTAQPLLVVARDGAPDVLVPDVPEIVVGVDTEAGRVFLRPPEGLFE